MGACEEEDEKDEEARTRTHLSLLQEDETSPLCRHCCSNLLISF